MSPELRTPSGGKPPDGSLRGFRVVCANKNIMAAISKIQFSIIFLVVIVSSCAATSAIADNPTMTFALQGTIFINLHNINKFAEYKFSDGHIVKTIDGKVSRTKKDGREQLNWWSDEFKKQYYNYRIYRYNMEEKLAAFLSQYNLVSLEHIQRSYFRHILFGERLDLKIENIYLTGPGRKPEYFTNYTSDFYPNKQFSHIIHRDPCSALINTATKRVTFPFGVDGLDHLDWNSSGQLLAYSFQGHKAKQMYGNIPSSEIRNRDQATLVIFDVSNEQILLKKNLGDRKIADIAWSPDSTQIGVLSYRARLGIWPWELIAAGSGHPIFHETFSLELYDIKGDLLYEMELDGSYTGGDASIIWFKSTQPDA